jgi:hypothetical protein
MTPAAYELAGASAWVNGALPIDCELEGAPLRHWMTGYVTFGVCASRRKSAIPPVFPVKQDARQGQPWTAQEWMFLRAAYPSELPGAWIAELLQRNASAVRQAAHAIGLKRGGQ